MALLDGIKKEDLDKKKGTNWPFIRNMRKRFSGNKKDLDKVYELKVGANNVTVTDQSGNPISKEEARLLLALWKD